MQDLMMMMMGVLACWDRIWVSFGMKGVVWVVDVVFVEYCDRLKYKKKGWDRI